MWLARLVCVRWSRSQVARYTGPIAAIAATLQLLQQPHCSTAAAVGHRVSVSTHSVAVATHYSRARCRYCILSIYISTEAAGTKQHTAVLQHEAAGISTHCIYTGQLTRAASLAGVPAPGRVRGARRRAAARVRRGPARTSRGLTAAGSRAEQDGAAAAVVTRTTLSTSTQTWTHNNNGKIDTNNE